MTSPTGVASPELEIAQVQPPAESIGHPPARGNQPHRRRRFLVFAGVVVALVAALVAWSAGNRKPTPLPGPVIAEAGSSTMRAEVRPVRRATLAAMSAGTVEELFVQAGQPVESKAPLARIQGPAGAETIVAPWRGTVTRIAVHVGDTLQPGAVVATVADLSLLQIETLDVDEFQVAKLQPGQLVALTVDALGQTISGRIRAVALEPQVSSGGDSNYLVLIDPESPPAGLRSGMSVRVRATEER